MTDITSSEPDHHRHHFARPVCVDSTTAVVGPMAVCIAPERTKRLHGPLNVADMRRSTRKLNNRSAIVSAQEKHREMYVV